VKILIEHYGLKRALEGTGFNICGSREDLLRIANQIKERADSDQFSYGWIKIRNDEPDEHYARDYPKAIHWMDFKP
jgi:hypothetical protein